MATLAVAEDGLIAIRAISLSYEEEALARQQTYRCERCGQEVSPFYMPLEEILGKSFIVSRMCPCEQRYQAKMEQERKCDYQKAVANKIFADSMMSARFKSSSFEQWERAPGTERMFKEAVHVVNNFNKRKLEGDGLILCGPSGIGKTHLLAAAANTLLKLKFKVVFVNVPDLLRKIRATYSRNSNANEGDIFKQLLSSDMVILDDLGAERITDWVEETLYVLINGLYTKKAIIMASTNMQMMDLGDQIGERSSDRIIQMCRIVECDVPSYRQELARRKAQEVLFGTEIDFKPGDLPFETEGDKGL